MTPKRVLSALILAAAIAGPASAQQGAICAERGKIIAQLEERHGETRQSFGLQQSGSVIETFANAETGSWTIIVSLPTGMSCLMAAGEAFQKEAQKVALKGRGA